MQEFKKLLGASDIPVYFQKMPDIVESVSMAWVLFTGASDDRSVGDDGLYHWFEHIPFRGTKFFPNGYADTKGKVAQFGGTSGASTTMHSTNFICSMPREFWKDGFLLISDLFGRPLITPEGVEAERQIIFEEIRKMQSSLQRIALLQLQDILWSDKHPFGRSVFGTEKSLSSMNVETLRKAFSMGYDRKRAMLVCSGNITEQELLDTLYACENILPDNDLSPISQPKYFGPLPWKSSITDVSTDFSSSLAQKIFPIEGEYNKETFFSYLFLARLIDFGGLSSPLLRILREERRLVYGANVVLRFCPGGGYIGLQAECKKESLSSVMNAFDDLLHDPCLCTEDRLLEVKQGIKYSMKMEPISTSRNVDKFIEAFVCSGENVRDTEYLQFIESLRAEDIKKMLKKMQQRNNPIKQHDVRFIGK